MEFNEKTFEDIIVLSVTKEMIGELESRELHTYINNIISNGTVKIAIDLSEVRWLSSSGLGVLVAIRNILVEKGGDLKLVGVTEKVQNLLTLTQLIHLFKTTDTVEQAVSDFKN